MHAGIQMMAVSDLLALSTFDADAYCRHCAGLIAGTCRCGRVDPFPVGPTTVGDLLEAKRGDENYSKVLAWVESGQDDHPLHLCFWGRCLTDGHHRVAAAMDLSREQMQVAQDGDEKSGVSCVCTGDLSDDHKDYWDEFDTDDGDY